MCVQFIHRASDTHMKPADLPLRAEFNPLIRPYLVVSIALTLAVTVVGIPLSILWLLGIGQWWARHYFDKLECELTDQSLRYRKGILFQVEKTIPLENIQDVTFIEGPLLKRFNLSILKFETAGQSAGQANEMKLVGIIDAHDFRAQILAARERIKHRHAMPANAVNPAVVDRAQAESLRSIQQSLEEIATLLKERLPK
jgi:membrane protein YdbS with pleckstrin-like domain